MQKKLNGRKCSVVGCGRKATGWQDGMPYCNKHWLRIYLNGDVRLHGKKTKTKYIKHEKYAEGVTSKGVKFKFDLDDWDKVTQHSWSTLKSGYLVCTYKQKQIRLHRLVTNAPDNGLVIDHINGDKLDNRKENLRITTQKNNSRNLALSKNNRTGVTGVSKTPNGKYRARIMVDRKEIRLGTFETLKEAAVARKNGEIKYFGEFSRNHD